MKYRLKLLICLFAYLLISGCSIDIALYDVVTVTAKSNKEKLFVIVNGSSEYKLVSENGVYTAQVEVYFNSAGQTLEFHDGRQVVFNLDEVRVNDFIVCRMGNDKEYVFDTPMTQSTNCLMTSDQRIVPSGKDFGIAVAQEIWDDYIDPYALDGMSEVGVDWRTVDIEVNSFDDKVTVVREYNLSNPNMTTACYVNTQELFNNNFDRVWQNEVYQTIVTKYPNFIFRDTSGKPLELWSGMTFMDIRIYGANYNGYRYIDFITDEIIRFVKSRHGVCSEIHLDNYNYVQGWFYLFGEFSGDMWLFEAGQREGRRFMAKKLRDELHIPVSIRSSTHKFADVADGIYYENAFSSTAVPGGLFEHVMQLQWIVENTRHCVVNQGNDDPDELVREAEAMKLYALALIFGCDANPDRLGDQGHGFQLYESVKKNLGNPTSETFEANPPRLFKRDIVVTAGSTIVIPAQREDTVIAFMDIEGGTFGQSAVTGLFENEDAERKGFYWDSGLRSNVTNIDNPQIRFDGIGQLRLTYLLVYKHLPVYARQFENGVVYFNTSKETFDGMIFGKQVHLAPESGVIVYN